MIVLVTEQGLIEMPIPQPDDAMTIEGKCSHGQSLFDVCHDCRWLEVYPIKEQLK